MSRPVIALAGRRTDPPDVPSPAFAVADVPIVAERLRALMQELDPVAMVVCAARGADLLALQIAGELQIRRRVVLPFEAERFRVTSVTDLPDGAWGALYDRVIGEVRATNDLVILQGGDDVTAAYAAANGAVLDEARVIAGSDAPTTAVIVWEGERRLGEDLTRDFARAAVDRGFSVRIVQTRPRTFTDIPSVNAARRVLNGESITAQDAVKLCKKLRDDLAYWYARELAERIRAREDVGDRDRFELLRVQVSCTYKDLALPTETRLAKALRLLKDAGYDPDRTTNPEALGLAGAIYKRWWQYDGQRVRIERALHYYRRAYGDDETIDDGYQAVNAALCLDYLARRDLVAAREAVPDAQDLTEIDPSVRTAVNARQQEARQMRSKLVENSSQCVGKKGKEYLATDWWYHATMAEAYLGLDEYDQARDWLKRGTLLPGVEDWQYEATATQLASVAQLRHELNNTGEFDESSAAWRAVRDGFGRLPVAGVNSALVGRIGLALSGGGFRASLYHIGLLARLAELDVLRGIEVLSCVSGGSIVGALYYLQVRHLLETTPDDQITKEHYVEIVRRVERDLLAGVQTDIRSRVFSSIVGALRNAFSSSYSQTARLGELFEEVFYGKVPDGEGSRPRWMGELYVEPARSLGEQYEPDRPFNPRLENWRRRAKVPILIINATTLNTGHAWQFTSSWMGEPQSRGDVVSRVPQLSPMRYIDAPDPYKRVRLGHAVAASAAVPGLFDPLVLPGLFDGLAIRLADGGVHDNQGTASLLDQDCSMLVISDGSGQISLADDPGGGRVGVPLRANDILMARVRELEFHLVSVLQRAALVRSVVFVHLTQGLIGKSRQSSDSSVPAGRAISGPDTRPDELLTPYGMRRDMQERLAALRTDLDAFTDLEACALMTSAYLATAYEWGRCSPDFPTDQSLRLAWSFDKVRRFVASDDGGRERYERTAMLLDAGHRRIWKEWVLSPGAKWFRTQLGRFFSGTPGRKRISERTVALTLGALAALPSALHRRFGTPRWLKLGAIAPDGGGPLAKGGD